MRWSVSVVSPHAGAVEEEREGRIKDAKAFNEELDRMHTKVLSGTHNRKSKPFFGLGSVQLAVSSTFWQIMHAAICRA
jgi:hypothetical protein